MPRVTFPDTDETFETPSGSSLLELCEEHGAPVPFACTSGVCGTCVVVLEEGADKVNPLEADEESTLSSATDVPGARLACQLTVQGDLIVKAIG